MEFKMSDSVSARPETSVRLSYQLLRNTTSPDEVESGVKSYVANVSAFEVLKLDTRDNLRTYIAEYSPRKRNRVHQAIQETIQEQPQRFITRNSGFTVSASEILVNDDAKWINLTNASIINGSQSQGEIRRWLVETYGADAAFEGVDAPFFVRLEIVVDPDPAEIIETAIARNTATRVESVSQVGARGQLDELQVRITEVRPDVKIKKSETDLDAYDTRKILQYARLLMPVSVSKNDSASEKLRAYKNPEQCLSDFSAWHSARKTDPDAAAKYNFTIEIAASALTEYEYWENHEAWNGHNIWETTKKGGRACRRDPNGKIIWVSAGLVFPILGAMSEFVERREGRWTIAKPSLFMPNDMVATAIAQFRGIGSDPMQMGRSAGVYDALRIYPKTLVAVMHSVSADTSDE